MKTVIRDSIFWFFLLYITTDDRSYAIYAVFSVIMDMPSLWTDSDSESILNTLGSGWTRGRGRRGKKEGIGEGGNGIVYNEKSYFKLNRLDVTRLASRVELSWDESGTPITPYDTRHDTVGSELNNVKLRGVVTTGGLGGQRATLTFIIDNVPGA